MEEGKGKEALAVPLQAAKAHQTAVEENEAQVDVSTAFVANPQPSKAVERGDSLLDVPSMAVKPHR